MERTISAALIAASFRDCALPANFRIDPNRHFAKTRFVRVANAVAKPLERNGTDTYAH